MKIDTEQLRRLIASMPSFADYTSANENYSVLGKQARALSERRSEIATSLAALPAAAKVSQRAEGLVKGQIYDSDGIRRKALKNELEQVEPELDAVTEALEMQRRIVENVRERLAEEVRASVRPEHEKLVQAIAIAMHALSLAIVEEAQLISALRDCGLPTVVSQLGPGGWAPGPSSKATIWAEFVKRDAGYSVTV